MLEPGDMVSERVRLGERLTRGGMGSVWEGEHLTLQAKVAVKLIALERQDDPSAIARFMSEASAAAQVRSPHVVQTFDHGVTEDGVPFIVMEMLHGETLRERLMRRGAMSPEAAALMIRQLGKALQAAHARHIVHRDIKPDNIFFVEQENDDDEVFIKVLDFGLAKRLDLSYGPNTSIGTLVGTPSYMSPEQALSNAELDHRADLWGMAVVAFHALTGEVPFAGETIGSLCVAIAASEYTPATELRPALPKTIDAIFARAFDADIDARYQRASDVARAFGEALLDVPRASFASIPEHPASTKDLEPNPTLDGAVANHPPMARSRTPLVLGLLAVLIALIVVASFGSGDDPRSSMPAAQANTGSPPTASATATTQAEAEEDEAPLAEASSSEEAPPAPDPPVEGATPSKQRRPVPSKRRQAGERDPSGGGPPRMAAPVPEPAPNEAPPVTKPDERWAF